MSNGAEPKKEKGELKPVKVVAAITRKMADEIREIGVQLTVDRRRSIPESEVLRYLLQLGIDAERAAKVAP